MFILRVVVGSREKLEQVVPDPFGQCRAGAVSSFVQQADVDRHQAGGILVRSYHRLQSKALVRTTSINFNFAFYSLRVKLTKTDVTANTSRSSPRV